MDWYQAVGVAVVVGFIGPAFWLLVALLESRLQAKRFPLAGVDLASLETWGRLLRWVRQKCRRR